MSVAVVIPLYNHGASLRRVVLGVLDYTPLVVVVDDGSTDGGAATIADLPVHCLVRQHEGKGAALLAGARAALALGARHMITLDADGQHLPRDIPDMLAAISREPRVFLVGARDFHKGAIPALSRIGRAVSGFWMRVQTGSSVSDMQSGFRAYPIEALLSLHPLHKGYAFEIEILVLAVWAGYTIREIPVHVVYPKDRVSHFHAVRDNLAITCLNTRLTLRALLPLPYATKQPRLSEPATLVRALGKTAPHTLAVSAGLAVFLGTLPLLGLQVLLLLLAIGTFRLNRVAALLAFPLTVPPLVPGCALLLGYRLRSGGWPADCTLERLGALGFQVGDRLLDWIVGSLCLAPVLAVLVGVLVFVGARVLWKGGR